MFMKQIGCQGAFADLRSTWLTIEFHQNRVGELSRVVALQMGLRRRHAAMIANAAVLHDIGKFFIRPNYFAKHAPLTAKEWEIVRQHPIMGHAVLSASKHPLLQMAATIALQHHEHWDGSGYPNRLSGEQICLEARIVSICDVYDALRDERPYHRAMNHEQATRVILCGDGRTEPRMFDPVVRRAFQECGPKLDLVFSKNHGHAARSPARQMPGAARIHANAGV